MNCNNCGAVMMDGVSHCHNCGTPAYPNQHQGYQQPQYQQPQYQQPSQPQPGYQQPYQQQGYQQPQIQQPQGGYQQPYGQQYNPNVNMEDLNILLKIVCVLFPLAGLIMYIVWRKSAPQKAKSAIIFGAIGVAINFILFI